MKQITYKNVKKCKEIIWDKSCGLDCINIHCKNKNNCEVFNGSQAEYEGME